MAEAAARGVFRQLFAAAAGLADAGMTHRDIKPENILCEPRADGGLEARLIDFGLAAFLDDGEQMGRRCGTPGFIAPEILGLLGAEPAATLKSDCFSLGATLYFAVTGSRLFGSSEDSRETLRRNLQGFSGELSGASAELADLLTRLGRADPNERLSATEALAHPWFQEHAP
jgi:serine/threonine protein kinase